MTLFRWHGFFAVFLKKRTLSNLSSNPHRNEAEGEAAIIVASAEFEDLPIVEIDCRLQSNTVKAPKISLRGPDLKLA